MKRIIDTLFLDRDGVLNEEAGHLTCWEEVKMLDGAFNGLKLAKEVGLNCVVITNQSGIARGFLEVEQLEEIHRRMSLEIEARGGALDGIYYSPFHPDPGPTGVSQFAKDSACRKPGVGLFERAQEERKLDLSTSVMVGDSGKDFKAAARLNIPFFGVRSAKVRELEELEAQLFDDLEEVVQFIIKNNG